MNRSTILLRKIDGVFGACWRSFRAIFACRPALAGPSPLAAVGAFLVGALPALAVLAVLALLVLVPHAHHSAGLAGLAMAGTLDQEFKDTVEKLGRAFEEFKASNNERLKQIETRGSADAVTVAKVEKANADITALEKQLQETRSQIREMETANARLTTGTRETQDKEREYAAQFFSRRRGRPVDPTEVDVQAYRDYRKAFGAMLRQNVEPLTADMRAALTTGSNPAGGYDVPPDLAGRIVKMIYETSPMRSIANVQTTGRDRLIGYYDLDEADSGWTAESSPRPETATPERGRWEIPVNEQWANPKASQDNLDDADYDVEAWLTSKVANKLSRRENTGFVVGDGVGKPRGFTTYPAGLPTKATFAKIEVVKTGVNGAFAANAVGDVFIDTIGKMKEAYLNGSAWVMNRVTKAAVRKIKDANDNYYLLPDFRNGFSEQLLGFPIVAFEDMADIANASLSIGFGNFREAYQIVDRQGIRVLRDPFTGKPFVQFYSTKRVGGDVVNFEAIKLIQFSA